MKVSRRQFVRGIGVATATVGMSPFLKSAYAETVDSTNYTPACKEDHIRIAMIKAYPKYWDVEHNWQLFEKLTKAAAGRGAHIICTPECFLDGYAVCDKENFTDAKFKQISQPLHGPGYVRKASALAKELKIHIVFGFTELAENGSYNSAAFIDDTGKILGVYHKTHLDPESQDQHFLPGQDFPVWNTKLGPIGIMICADRRWPESARSLKVQGAKLIMNPTFGMSGLDNEWWMRTRSYENELYICFTHPAVALITNPGGGIAARYESNLPDILVHDISIKNIDDKMFKMRRPDIYKIS